VVGVGVGRHDRHDLRPELLADRLDDPLPARLVEAGVDHRDPPVVEPDHAGVDAAGDPAHPIGQPLVRHLVPSPSTALLYVSRELKP
jgi:hypothetical protein